MFNRVKKIADGKFIKEERFKKVASRRVQEILKKMRLLRNCANKNNYSYDSHQVSKIFSAVDNEWRRVKLEFDKSKHKGDEFRLD